MKKLTLYYITQIIVNIVLLVVFRDSITIGLLSVFPLFIIFLMAFQTVFFKSDKKQDPTATNTAYPIGESVSLTNEEQDKMYEYLKISFWVLLPLEIPFIFFLTSYAKLLCLLPYIFAYILGGSIFKIKMGKAIQERVELEKRELQEQMRKEELGLK